jgi:hypothetical protein
MMWFEQAAAAVSAFLRVHWAAVPQAQCVHGACTGGGGSDYDALMRRRACHLLATAPQSCCNPVHGACAGGGGSAERTHAAVGKRLEAAEASDSSAEGGALCWVVELAHRGDAVRLIMIGCTIRNRRWPKWDCRGTPVTCDRGLINMVVVAGAAERPRPAAAVAAGRRRDGPSRRRPGGEILMSVCAWLTEIHLPFQRLGLQF